MFKIIDDPKDGDVVQFVGVHALAWRPEWGKPTVAFVEMDDTKPTAYEEAARGLLKLVEETVDDKGLPYIFPGADEIKAMEKALAALEE